MEKPTATLKITMAATKPATVGRWVAMKTGLMSIPIETKKRVANRSRKGSTSARIWWLWSDSLTTIPAMKAPSASESPIR
ncbi:hypothetical protein D3C86_1619410 [compost metagenome]